METAAGLGRLELIRIAENVAQEKGIGVEDVIVAMEQAIQTGRGDLIAWRAASS
jgi:hypothetical protein